MPLQAAQSPVRATAQCEEIVSRWTGAGDASLVKAYGPGVVSCVRTAAGKYTVTFNDTTGVLLGFQGMTHTVADAFPQFWKCIFSTFNTSTKVVNLECWECDGAAALVAPTSGAPVTLRFTFGRV